MITYPQNIRPNNKPLFAMLCKRFNVENLNDLSHEIFVKSHSGVKLIVNNSDLCLHSVKDYEPDYVLQDDLSYPEFLARFKRFDEICLDVKIGELSINETHPQGMT